MSQVAERINSLSPQKRALLELRLKQRAARPRVFPLSFAQEQLWLLNQLQPDNPAYNICTTIRLRGALDLFAFEQALGEIERRHEMLRTTFEDAGEGPTQVVGSPRTHRLPVVDLEGLPEEAQLRCAQANVALEGRRPFDLARGPLWRHRLLRLGARDHAVIFAMHHIVSDGWSMGLLLSELAELYEAFAHGCSSPLVGLAIQYGDYASWQRGGQQEQALGRQLDYWRRQLAGAPAALALPTDRPRSERRSFAGAHEMMVLPAELTASLLRLAAAEGATPFMVLLCGFAAVLSRYSGQEDMCVGTPVANRGRAEVEGLIGFFVNTLVVRVDASGGPTLRQLLARVREAALGAYDNQDVSFAKLVEELQPAREQHYTPFFQVLFNLQNLPKRDLRLGDLKLGSLGNETGATQFDLGFDLAETSGVIVGSLEYSTELFDATTIRRLLRHFAVALETLAGDPDARVSAFPLLVEAERQQLLREWNDTETRSHSPRLLHLLIEAQAAAAPDRTAVVYEDGQLTYGELDRRAALLARHLSRRGAGPDTLVGVCAERSLEMIVSVLAVLKAGAAYVPLNPDYPKERLAFMLEDSGLSVLVTHERKLGALPEHRAEVVCVDADWPEIVRGSGDAAPAAPSPAALAYVIYTSGSTGRPKGVMISHDSFVNAYLAWERAYRLREETACHFQMANFSFDVFSGDFARALCSGARLVLCPSDYLLDPERLYELMREQEVDCAEFVPAVVRVLMRHLEETRQTLDFMRLLAVGSDTWRLSEYRRLRGLCGAATRLVNSYGLTEATIDSSYFEAGPDDSAADGPVPIGRPFDNTRLRVVDPSLQLVPVGVAGELLVEGPGLARGHLNRPALTAERYVPSPFATEPGARAYRTGDLARHLADGRVELLGRADNQVKLRSNRLELGEIEAALAQHPAIRQNVVTVREDGEGEKRLAAYVVVDPEHPSLQEQLPVPEMTTEQVAQWAEVFDELYREYDSDQQLAFYIKGWDSSYTGQRIPADEVHEWMQQTVDRVLALGPRRVMEIGSGTGLMLFRIAPRCEHYYATDISENALRILRQQIEVWPERLPATTTLKEPTEALSELEPDSLDTVIMVSVAQYFPSAEYLLRVLEGAIRVVRPGGHIFLGDVRCLPLLKAFHTSVQLYQSPGELTLAELQYRVQTHMTRENQLVVDPDFFNALSQHSPKLAGASVLLERAHARNELSKFRYDVVLRVGGEASPLAVAEDCLDWQGQGATVEEVRRLLTEERPQALRVAQVPNARVASDVKAAGLLGRMDGTLSVKDLLRALRGAERGAVEPEEFWALADETPYEVEVIWSGAGAVDCYDVIFRRHDGEGRAAQASPDTARAARRRSSLSPAWNEMTNNPLQGKFANQLIPELRQFLQQKLPDYMVPSAFVMLDSLPLNANGKVDRKALPAPILQAADPGGGVDYRSEAERLLAELWASVLGLARVGRTQNFFELGGDSILSIQVVARARQAGLGLTARQLFEHPTVEELASVVARPSEARAASAEQGTVAGEGPLTPIQRWFFGEQFEEQHHWNQAVMLVGEGLRGAAVEAAVSRLVEHHDALRMRYERGPGGEWLQRNAEAEVERTTVWVDLTEVPEGRQEELQVRLATEVERGLELREGPVVRAAVFERGGGKGERVLMVVHHLVVDGVSWRVLLEDLERGYEQAARGEKIVLPSKTSSFRSWALRLAEYAREPERLADLDYWLSDDGGHESDLAGRLRPDHELGPNTVASARVVLSELDEEETRALLQDVPAVYQTQIQEALLTGLVRALVRQTGSESWLVDLEGHGREELFEELDVTRTVGWFTTVYPVRLRVGRWAGEGEALKAVKEQLRRVPGRGLGYGLLRYMAEDESVRRRLGEEAAAELSFNYLGQFDQGTQQSASLFRPVAESPGLLLSPRGRRAYLLEVDGGVNAGRLQMGWTYSENYHRRETVEALADGFVRELRALVAHCHVATAAGVVTSDFGEVGWGQDDVEDVVASLSREL